VRAYGDAASAALEQAGRRVNYVTTRIRVEIPFSLYDALMKVASHFNAVQRGADFSDRVTLELEVRSSSAESLTNEIVQLSSGKAVVETIA
jgi:putative IMPACT (imprinted ancient) family translation regulator